MTIMLIAFLACVIGIQLIIILALIDLLRYGKKVVPELSQMDHFEQNMWREITATNTNQPKEQVERIPIRHCRSARTRKGTRFPRRNF